MKRISQKKIAFLVLAVLFVLSLVPAFYPAEDEAPRRDCPFCNAYGQLLTALNSFFDFGTDIGWSKTSASLEIACNLPNSLPSSSETRAPPA